MDFGQPNVLKPMKFIPYFVSASPVYVSPVMNAAQHVDNPIITPVHSCEKCGIGVMEAPRVHEGSNNLGARNKIVHTVSCTTPPSDRAEANLKFQCKGCYKSHYHTPAYPTLSTFSYALTLVNAALLSLQILRMSLSALLLRLFLSPLLERYIAESLGAPPGTARLQDEGQRVVAVAALKDNRWRSGRVWSPSTASAQLQGRVGSDPIRPSHASDVLRVIT
ncbi:hypothetical protein FB451DRAFT_1231720 [Mycena latifolia]|nr:hypothetical protein FB451DRAFT_1231720 [Mycena latifolia]